MFLSVKSWSPKLLQGFEPPEMTFRNHFPPVKTATKEKKELCVLQRLLMTNFFLQSFQVYTVFSEPESNTLDLAHQHVAVAVNQSTNDNGLALIPGGFLSSMADALFCHLFKHFCFKASQIVFLRLFCWTSIEKRRSNFYCVISSFQHPI